MTRKATHLTVTREYLNSRETGLLMRGYAKPKWIGFCEEALNAGLDVSLYEARRTFSKYVTLRKDGKSFKVRFSNHKPIRQRELTGDCDFFVGRTHTGVRTTEDALVEVRRFFEISDEEDAA